MKFFIDAANFEQIKAAQVLRILDGVTTNPSLMAKGAITGQENILKHYVDICNIVEVDVLAEVINIHTIIPLDEEAIFESVVKTGCVVTAEEHNVFGGLGESVARFLTINNPIPQEFVAVNDSFG